MIKELRVNNLAIIKDMQIELEENFSVLTGETGAGKSIILDGIAFILGARANTSVIRHNENKLIVEAVISLSSKLVEKLKLLDFDIDYDDNELIIYRELQKDGKSKISINGKRATSTMLMSIMSNVVDIVGQHENQYLLNHNYHLELLDGFIDKKEFKLKEIVTAIRETNNKIEQLEEEKRKVTEKKDLYEFNINEIENLDLYEGIDEELENKYNIIFNSGRIQEVVDNVNYEIDEVISTSLKKVVRHISNISSLADNIENIRDEFVEIVDRISELSNEINELYQDDFEMDSLEEISDKLNKINKCKSKYANSITGILEYKEDLENKLNRLEYSSDEIEKLKQKKEELLHEYEKMATKLSQKRKKVAKELEKEVDNELLELNMKHASFKVEFTDKTAISENGIDGVEFLLKSNAGQDYVKLSKCASGGEISRIMLALKIVFSKVDNIECLIFDEIDTGISGETVKLVAQKLKKLSDTVQVICVTHSPSIASMGKEQFLIYKTVENDSTSTSIRKLSFDERIKEIARIISGDNVTNALLEHVKEMLMYGKISESYE